MNNLEKLLIFISDEKFTNEVISSLEGLSLRSNNNNSPDIAAVKRKLENIKKLCQEKHSTQY